MTITKDNKKIETLEDWGLLVGPKSEAQSLFGPMQKGEPHVRKLRYQLLTASAGAICEASRREPKMCIRGWQFRRD